MSAGAIARCVAAVAVVVVVLVLGLGAAAAQPAPPAPKGPKPIAGKCPAGYKLKGHDQCVRAATPKRCPAGQAITVDTAGHCCWIGQSWLDGRCIGDPTQCPTGYEIDRPGQQCRLKPCPSGQIRGRDGVTCTSCAPEYQPDASATTCELRRCEGGRVRANDQVHCCWPGQAWNTGRRQCIGAPQCPTWYQRDASGFSCVLAACPASQVRASDGVSCRACAAGQIKAAGASACTACTSGYEPDAAKQTCVLSACGAGKVRAADGVTCVATSRIRIETRPAGELYQARSSGRTRIGSTPWESSLGPGHYEFIATASGYDDDAFSIDVAAGAPQVLTRILRATPTTGRIELHVNVPATVSGYGYDDDGYDDALRRGLAQVHTLEVAPGGYSLTLTAARYQPQTLEVEVGAGSTTRRDVTLAPIMTSRDPIIVKTVPEVPRPKVHEVLAPAVTAAVAVHRAALDARDQVGYARVRKALKTTAAVLCTAGGVALNIWGISGDHELGTGLLAITGGGLTAGICYWTVLRQIGANSSDLGYAARAADRQVAAARSSLIGAIADYRGGRRGSLLSRRPPPRFGGGVAFSDGLVVGSSTEHAGFGIEVDVLVNLGWLHPEVALEANPGAELVVARPGLRVSLGRFFFLRAAAELALVGRDETWSGFGGLGVRLPVARTVSWQLAADYARTVSEPTATAAGPGEPTMTVRARTGVSVGF